MIEDLLRDLDGHPESEARRRAARLLGELDEGASAYSGLSRALVDPDPRVRIEAAEALWKVEPGLLVSVPCLLALARGDEPDVRDRAQRLLRRMDVDVDVDG